jgi:hypothetical protein
MKLFSLVLTLSLLLSQHPAHSCSPDGKEGFLPDNDLEIPVSNKLTGLTEEQFHRVINKVEKVYAPLIRDLGYLLKIERRWTSATVNAGTYRDEGGYHWHIIMHGGLARHKHITEDGFAQVICHEIGHHLGGAPKKKINVPANFWSSSEGQADYYATLKCLRKIFEKEDFTETLDSVPSFVQNQCRLSHKSEKDALLCMKLSMAGYSTSMMSASIRNSKEVDFSTPDPRVVTETYERHPLPQCRLDSTFQGALCEVHHSLDVSQSDEVQGTCHQAAGHDQGLRPACWFKPGRVQN